MSEYLIQKPCDNCELKGLLESDEGVKSLVLDGIYMAICEKNAMQSCKHPWRLLNEVFEGSPTEPQAQIMGKIVKIRGKNPNDYNLPSGENISTLDI